MQKIETESKSQNYHKGKSTTWKDQDWLNWRFLEHNVKAGTGGIARYCFGDFLFSFENYVLSANIITL